MTINSAIRDYMKKHEISQSFVAEQCGWTRERMSCIAKGKQRVSAEDLRRICDVLKLPYDYFYNTANDRR